MICQAIKKNGQPCTFKSLYGGFCGVHKGAAAAPAAPAPAAPAPAPAPATTPAEPAPAPAPAAPAPAPAVKKLNMFTRIQFVRPPPKSSAGRRYNELVEKFKIFNHFYYDSIVQENSEIDILIKKYYRSNDYTYNTYIKKLIKDDFIKFIVFDNLIHGENNSNKYGSIPEIQMWNRESSYNYIMYCMTIISNVLKFIYNHLNFDDINKERIYNTYVLLTSYIIHELCEIESFDTCGLEQCMFLRELNWLNTFMRGSGIVNEIINKFNDFGNADLFNSIWNNIVENLKQFNKYNSKGSPETDYDRTYTFYNKY
jgi:hypothetical protein